MHGLCIYIHSIKLSHRMGVGNFENVGGGMGGKGEEGGRNGEFRE